MCKGNGQTQKDWQREKLRNPKHHHLLLIDSEGPLTSQPEPDQFFMVELMESWFLGDPEKLGAYFGDRFNANALPRRAIEEIPKRDVLPALNKAAKDTPKEKYVKARDSKALLSCIRLDTIRKSNAPNCERLLQVLEQLSPRQPA